MYKIQKNPSAVRSQIKIATSFLTLLKEGHSYKNVSVSDIADKARIVRKTFYSNFRSKEDIIAYVVDNTIENFLKNTDVEHIKYSHLYERLYGFLYSQREFLVLIHQSNLFDLVEKFATNYFIKNKIYLRYRRFALPRDKSWYYEYLPKLASTTVFLILRKWVSDNFAESPSALGKLTEDLLLGNLWK